MDFEHKAIRPTQPVDNAQVERCDRTVNDYGISGNEGQPLNLLQTLLDEAVEELAFELPFRVQGCTGHPPMAAQPESLQPHCPS